MTWGGDEGVLPARLAHVPFQPTQSSGAKATRISSSTLPVSLPDCRRRRGTPVIPGVRRRIGVPANCTVAGFSCRWDISHVESTQGLLLPAFLSSTNLSEKKFVFVVVQLNWCQVSSSTGPPTWPRMLLLGLGPRRRRVSSFQVWGPCRLCRRHRPA